MSTDTANFFNRVNQANKPNGSRANGKVNNGAPKVNNGSPKITVNNGSSSMPSSFIQASNSISSMGSKAVNATAAAVNRANEMLKDTTASLTNTFNQSIKPALFAPVQESIQGSFQSQTSPYVSIPVMIALGILVIALILMAMFRDQVSMALEVAWQKMKAWYHSIESGHKAPKVQKEHKEHKAASIVNPAAIHSMLPGKKEVFNIADNKYTYSDAEPLCKAFGAELATYDQVKEAWGKGADWCNYGWVKGQSAVYPTQQATYDKLQAGPEDQRMSCGTAGVNGGFFDNPELRFGVNCYGDRPTQNDADIRYAVKHEGDKTEGGLEYDRKVQDYKVHKDQIPVNPFKTGTWSS